MSRLKISFGSYKMRGIVELLRLYRPKSTSSIDSSVVAAARRRFGNNGYGLGITQSAGVRFVHAAKDNSASTSAASSGMGDDGKPIPSPPKPPTPGPPPRGRFPLWMIIEDNFRRVKLALGSVITLLVAYWTPQWATLLKIGGEAEIVVKEAEQAAEVVEKMATVVEKVSEELANDLPDGNKIKEAAVIVESISKEAAKDAHIAEEILHKIDAVEQDLKDVGEMVEPVINNIEHHEKSSKL